MIKPFLTAEWRKLIMAQYEVDPAILAPWLPPGVALDLYHANDSDRCYVSLVGFMFNQVRVKRVSIPFHNSFEEVNLRFYVTRTMPDGSRRRGVSFIREFVPREAVAMVAGLVYEEPYMAIAMGHSIHATEHALFVSYRWGHPSHWQRITVESLPDVQPIEPGSEEEFLTERYWGYTKRSKGAASEYQVEHPRWSIYPIQHVEIEIDFGALFGPEFAGLTRQAAASVLLAEGSAISVSNGTRLG